MRTPPGSGTSSLGGLGAGGGVLPYITYIGHREQRNCSRNIDKNVLPLNIAFLCLLALLKPHLQTKYKHSFAIDRTEPPLLNSVDRCLLGPCIPLGAHSPLDPESSGRRYSSNGGSVRSIANECLYLVCK